MGLDLQITARTMAALCGGPSKSLLHRQGLQQLKRLLLERITGLRSGARAGARRAACAKRSRSALLSHWGRAHQRLMVEEHHQIAERVDLPEHRVALVAVQAAPYAAGDIHSTEVQIVATRM
jgi:hypothetical protein